MLAFRLPVRSTVRTNAERGFGSYELLSFERRVFELLRLKVAFVPGCLFAGTLGALEIVNPTVGLVEEIF